MIASFVREASRVEKDAAPVSDARVERSMSRQPEEK
jgi:hypothetical protein